MAVTIIGIAGGSGSGKTSLARTLVAPFQEPPVCLISLDSFYRPLTDQERTAAFNSEHDFDIPTAIDFEQVEKTLSLLKSGQAAEIPSWSFNEHCRLRSSQKISPARVVIVEGIFTLYSERLLPLIDLKVFCDADGDVCLARRLVRDVAERGRDIQSALKQWFAFVKPNYHKYGQPQLHAADIIVPRGMQNRVAIDLIGGFIESALRECELIHREKNV